MDTKFSCACALVNHYSVVCDVLASALIRDVDDEEAPPPSSSSPSCSLLDSRILLALSRMHTEFEAACYRLAKVLPRDRLSLVFLINNFDLIITVLSVSHAALSSSCLYECQLPDIRQVFPK